MNVWNHAVIIFMSIRIQKPTFVFEKQFKSYLTSCNTSERKFRFRHRDTPKPKNGISNQNKKLHRISHIHSWVDSTSRMLRLPTLTVRIRFASNSSRWLKFTPRIGRTVPIWLSAYANSVWRNYWSKRKGMVSLAPIWRLSWPYSLFLLPKVRRSSLSTD